MTTTPPAAQTSPSPTGSLARRIVPVAIVAAGIGVFFALDLGAYVSFDALREHRATLTGFVADNAVLAALLYVLIYAVAVTLSLPGGLVMTVAGGFLFGTFLGTGLTVIAATLGATGIFLLARTAFGDVLRGKAGGAVERMAEGFRQDALSYLLVLRLVPLFPFFVVNIAPAILGVALRTFVIATALGIIPGTFVFASVGAGLGSVFETEGEFSPGAALTPEIITALIGLAVLSLVPVVYRKIKARRAAA